MIQVIPDSPAERDWFLAMVEPETGTRVFRDRRAVERRERPRLPVPVNASVLPDPVLTASGQLGFVQVRFGISKSQLARACKVERQTIYDWYHGKFVPAGTNGQRLNELFRLALRSQEMGHTPIDPKLVARVPLSGISLPDLLAEDVLNLKLVLDVLGQLSSQQTAVSARGAKQLKARAGVQALADAEGEANLRHNLGSLPPRE